MVNMRVFIIGILIVLGVSIFLLAQPASNSSNPLIQGSENQPKGNENLSALSIEYMRGQKYPGSEITIEETLPPGSNYSRYRASFLSEGLKIYGLLTVPEGEVSNNGFPVIIFNHGYIPPAEYRTTERYGAYTDVFSLNGYILFKPDFRGHDKSEGNPEGAYYSPAYTIDVLNAFYSLRNYKLKLPDKDQNINLVDKEKMGMWGHSMGGSLTLRLMVITKDIKAGVIWAGVVANYEDMAKNWRRVRPFTPSEREKMIRRPGRQQMIDKYGDFDKNPEFWKSIAPISFVSDISGPVQIHHGTQDAEVPLLFSERLEKALKLAGKEVEMYTYEGDDHNLAANLSVALQRSVDFFDKYLK